MKLIPKNWDKFQQYKDRKPSWIKLHRDLLNDFSYSSVQIGTKATLPLLWILACEYEDGIINASLEEISFRIHIDKKIVKVAIEELIETNFFSIDDSCTEAYNIVPREEKRREELETEREEESEASKVAHYLYSKILSVQPNLKSDWKVWIKDIDRAIRIDDRDSEHLKRCIDWIYDTEAGSFWQPNIMSGKKLREKYDTMEMQSKRPTKESERAKKDLFIDALCEGVK